MSLDIYHGAHAQETQSPPYLLVNQRALHCHKNALIRSNSIMIYLVLSRRHALFAAVHPRAKLPDLVNDQLRGALALLLREDNQIGVCARVQSTLDISHLEHGCW
jgi:hypothetical protein